MRVKLYTPINNFLKILFITVSAIIILVSSQKDMAYTSDNFDTILPGVLISKIEAKGNIICRPILVQNEVFYAVEESNNTVLYSVNPENGEILWATKLPIFNKVFSLSSNKDKIILSINTNYRGILYILDAENGNIIWTYKGDIIKSSIYPPFIYLQEELIRDPPLLAENLIYLTLGASRILALHIDTGKIIWQLKIGLGYTKVKVYLGKPFFFVKVAENYFKALNYKSGKEVNNPIPEHYISSITKIDNDFLIGDNYIFIQNRSKTGDDEILCYNFLNKTELWKKVKYTFFPMSYLDNAFYSIHSQSQGILGFKKEIMLTAIDANSGNEKWENSTCIFNTNSVLSSDDKIFIKCRDGNLFIINSNSGDIIWDMYSKIHNNKLIKYAYFYIKKGSDKAIFIINNMIYYISIG
jgi:outer membrane protein assembly factor BamB